MRRKIGPKLTVASIFSIKQLFMKITDLKFLLFIALLLVAACAPHQTSFTPSSNPLFGANQCKQLVKKQRQLARKTPVLKRNALPTQDNSNASFSSNALSFQKSRFATIPEQALAGNIVFPETELSYIPETNPISPVVRNSALHQAELQKQQFRRISAQNLSHLQQEKITPVAVKQESISKKTASLDADKASGHNWLAGLLGLSGLAGIFTLLFAPARFRAISTWASENSWKARTLIMGSHTATFFGSLALGNYLSDQGIYFSEVTRNTSLAIFTTTAFLYPVQRTFKFLKNTYLFQKIKDIIVFVSGAVLLLHFTNNHAILRQPGPPATQAVFSFKSVLSPGKTVSILKKNPSQVQINDQVPPKKEALIITILKIAAIIVVVSFLALALAALACNLACSGMEGLATAIMIAGVPGILVLGILLIRKVLANARSKNSAAKMANPVVPAPEK